MAPSKSRSDTREREVGTVLSVTSAGLITVRARGAHASREGTPVIDRQGRPIGRVYRVFGPVSHPFLSIRPRPPLRAGDAAALIGSSVREG